MKFKSWNSIIMKLTEVIKLAEVMKLTEVIKLTEAMRLIKAIIYKARNELLMN